MAEARRLVDTALRNYPDLASKDGEFLNRQLYSITLQQAAKDYEAAEFYRRRSHPCAAYFCYETVRRRYPGTKYADQATERMNELRAKVEKSMGRDTPDVPAPASAGAASPPRPLPPEMNNFR